MATDEQSFFDSLDSPVEKKFDQKEWSFFQSLEPEHWKYPHSSDPYASQSKNPVAQVWRAARSGAMGLSRDIYTGWPGFLADLTPGVSSKDISFATDVGSATLNEIRREMNNNISMTQPAPAPTYSPQWFTNSLVQMTPQLGSQTLVGAGFGKAGYAVTGFIQSASNQYSEAFDRKLSQGLSEKEAGKQAAKEALAVGAIIAATDALTFDAVMGKLKTKKGIGEILSNSPVLRILKGGVVEGGQEGVQEVLTLGVESISDLENYMTSENFQQRVLPSIALGTAAGAAVRGGVELGGYATDTPTVSPPSGYKYGLTPEDATRLVAEDPEAAAELIRSSRAGVNLFAKYGIERGVGNRKETAAQRKKFQEDVRREVEARNKAEEEARILRQQQEQQRATGLEWANLTGGEVRNTLNPQGAASATANAETSVPGQNQTGVSQANAQTVQENPFYERAWSKTAQDYLTGPTITPDSAVRALDYLLTPYRNAGMKDYYDAISSVKTKLEKRGVGDGIKIIRQTKGLPQEVRDKMVEYFRGDIKLQPPSKEFGPPRPPEERGAPWMDREAMGLAPPGQGPQALEQQTGREWGFLTGKYLPNQLNREGGPPEAQGPQPAPTEPYGPNPPPSPVQGPPRPPAQQPTQQPQPQQAPVQPDSIRVPNDQDLKNKFAFFAKRHKKLKPGFDIQDAVARFNAAVEGKGLDAAIESVKSMKRMPDELKNRIINWANTERDLAGAEMFRSEDVRQMAGDGVGVNEEQMAQDAAQQMQRQPGEIGTPPSYFGIPLKFGSFDGNEWIQNTLKKMSSLGREPRVMRVIRERAAQRIRRDFKEGQLIVRDIEKAVKKHFGKPMNKLDRQQADLLNNAINDQRVLRDLPEDIKIPVLALRNLIDTLSMKLKNSGMIDENLQIVFDQNLKQYTVRAYRIFEDKKWTFENVPKHIIDEARDFFRKEIPAGMPRDDVTVERTIRDFLADRESTNPILKGMKLAKNDLTSLMKRDDTIPKVIRDLMGEDVDIRLKGLRSVLKLSNMLAKYEMQNRLKEVGDGVFMWKVDDPNRPVDANYEIAKAGDATMGVLEGYRVDKDMFEVFRNVNSQLVNQAKWVQAVATLSMVAKVGQTILSVGTQVRNLLSNGWNLLAAGVWSPKAVVKYGAEALKLVSGKDRKGFLEAIEYGIWGEELVTSELRATANDAKAQSEFHQMMEEVAGVKTSPEATFRALLKYPSKGWKLLQSLYANGDAIPKYIYWKVEQDRHKGIFETEEELKAHTAELVKEHFPTYSRVFNAVKAVRDVPVIGTFVSFPAEIMRTRYNNLVGGFKESRSADPRIRSIGRKRVFGQLTVWAIPTFLALASRAILGITKEEEDAYRETAAPWEKASAFVFVGRNERGVPVAWDSTYMHTDSVLLKPAIAMLENGDVGQAFSEIVNPFASPDIATKALIDSWWNVDRETGRTVRDKNLDASEQALQVAEHLWDKAFEPGAFRDIRIANDARLGKTRKDGKEISKLNAALRFLGVKVASVEPETKAYYANIRYKKDNIASVSHFTSIARSKGDISDSEIMQGYLRMEQSRYNNFQSLRKSVMAAITLTDAQTVFSSLDDMTPEMKQRIMADAYEQWLPDDRFWKSVPPRNRAQVVRVLQEAIPAAKAQRSMRATRGLVPQSAQ